MCGIVGYIGKDEKKEIIINGLKELEYRGYDSAGIAVMSDKGKDITVRLAGGLLTVNYDGEKVVLTGETTVVFKGEFEY